jgi:hypothetical protein
LPFPISLWMLCFLSFVRSFMVNLRAVQSRRRDGQTDGRRCWLPAGGDACAESTHAAVWPASSVLQNVRPA